MKKQPALFANELDHCPICGHDPCERWLATAVWIRRWIIDHPEKGRAA